METTQDYNTQTIENLTKTAENLLAEKIGIERGDRGGGLARLGGIEDAGHDKLVELDGAAGARGRRGMSGRGGRGRLRVKAGAAQECQ